MKANLPLKKLEQKDAIQPNWEESKFAKTIDGQILAMLKKALENGHFIEAQVLSWSAIEQLLLPRLIGWIAKILKINLPKDIFRLSAKNINFLYLTISHDEKLYKKLEKSRKQRNKIVHRLVLLGDIKSINKLAKECTSAHLELQKEIMKRFGGQVLIPSINSYKNGWNDALSSAINKIRDEI